MMESSDNGILKHTFGSSIFRTNCLAANSGGIIKSLVPPRSRWYLTRRRSMLLILAAIQILPWLVYFSMLFSSFCLMLSINSVTLLSVWIGVALLEKYTTASFSTEQSVILIFCMAV